MRITRKPKENPKRALFGELVSGQCFRYNGVPHIKTKCDDDAVCLENGKIESLTTNCLVNLVNAEVIDHGDIIEN